PYSLISFQKACRLIGVPRAVTNSADVLLPRTSEGLIERYEFVHCTAFLPSGTRRSLLPLPSVNRKQASIFKSVCFCEPTSVTLNPVSYKTSSIALSRTPKLVEMSGLSSNRSTSSGSRNLGSDCQVLGDSRFAVGSRFKWPSSCMNR